MRNVFEKNSKTMDDDLIVKPAKAQSVVVRISSDGIRSLCFVLPNVTAPSHSLHTLPDGTVIYLSTTDGSVLHIDPRSGDIISSTKVTDGFLRGITSLNDRTLLLGTRGELLTFDLSAKRVVKRMKIPTDLNEAVYDIKRLPSHYSMPPLSFEEHFKKVVGYEAKDLILYNKNSVIYSK
jgi:streptogramin lyase